MLICPIEFSYIFMGKEEKFLKYWMSEVVIYKIRPNESDLR